MSDQQGWNPQNPKNLQKPEYSQGPPPGGAYPPPGYQAGGYPGQPQYGPPQYGPPPPYGAPPPYGYQQAPVTKPTGWFIVNWLFFWPTAIYSLVTHWSEIDRDQFAGNLAGAQYHADAVRKHGIIALCLGIGLSVLWLILVLSVFTVAGSNY